MLERKYYLRKEYIKGFIDTLAKKMRESQVTPTEKSVVGFIEKEESLQNLSKCNSTWGGEDISYDLNCLDIIYKGNLTIEDTTLTEEEKKSIEYFNINYEDTYLDFEFYNEEKIIISFSLFYEYSINGKEDRQPIIIYSVEV